MNRRTQSHLIMRSTMTLRLFSLALVALVAVRAAAQDQPAAPAAADNTAALADFALHDPVVAAALDLPRDTPAHQLRVILALVDLGRNDVAALLVPELLAAQVDDAERAALVREFGSARFMQLIRLDGPAAEGAAPNELAGMREFAQKCLDAAAAEANDPARLAKIIAEVNAPTEEARYAARVDLRATGDAGVAAAMSALATAETPAARANLRAALAEMRPAVDAPLVAVLAEARGPLRADAATLAGRLKIRAALPWLAALAVSESDPAASQAARNALASLGLPMPTPEEAQTMLRARLADIDAAARDAGAEPGDPWWSWDPAKNQLAAAHYPPQQTRALARARLTHALAEAGALANPADRRMTMVDLLEEAGLLSREPSPEAAKLLASMTPAEVSNTLGAALDSKRLAAAARLAAELGARKDLGVLATADGRPSPLAAALASSDRDLRFAALAAVMDLNPPRSFPGASHVAEALWYFAAGTGEPAAVVAAPIFTRASDWAGQLRGLGYEAMPTATGHEALTAALDPAASTRLAVILLDGDLDRPVVREVIFQLRSAERSAHVPIIVASSAERYEDAQRLADDDPLVLAAPRPHGEGALATLVERAVALADHPLANKEMRTAQAAKALDWLARLLEAGTPYDELRRDGQLVNRTLFVPELADPSIRVFAALGTAESQSALADYASAQSIPIATRRAAAAALAASVKRFGTQLTSAQILRQYDRYNASETADADTQAILGGILDIIEKKK
jgi:hypothetical protein